MLLPPNIAAPMGFSDILSTDTYYEPLRPDRNSDGLERHDGQGMGMNMTQERELGGGVD